MIEGLNKNFDSRVRLGIMAILMVNDWVDFGELKERLELSDGNLASHIAALETVKYIDINKEFVGKKPRTTYKLTLKGKTAFSEHISALEKIIKLNM